MVHFVMLHGIAWYYIYGIVPYCIILHTTSDHNQYLPIQAEVGNVIYFLLPFCGQWHCGWVGGCKAQKAAITISV